MTTFAKEYKQLNDSQKKAVDTINGPLLVIAGPGTGKTQLLSARVAQILQQTDTLPQNILCLTFTESGAQNMRDRLTRFIGPDAYNVTISTYHAFGGDLIKRFPEYFSETRLQDPIDDLGRHQIIANIVEKMSYLDPLKQTRHHLGDLITTISEVKRAMLGAEDLRQVADENNKFIKALSHEVRTIFDGLNRMPPKLDKSLPYFDKTLAAINQLAPDDEQHSYIRPLAVVARDSLEKSIEEAIALQKSTPLTEWKNEWLAKDSDNHYIVAGSLENDRIRSLANVLDSYSKELEARGFYDFDDMIVRSVKSLEKNPDLKYTLQEQYLYILLDEFQDTNRTQLRLVELLSDNPVNERSPNIMAVGDDDQAIYAFQGAQYSNMLQFYEMFEDVKVINLSQNYRSHADILLTAENISDQIKERLHTNSNFKNMTKSLIASNDKLPNKATISRNEFLSDISQYDWIAQKIHKLIQDGVPAKEIAVLAPKHRFLEPLVPYLNELGVPVRYEKRENILEAPVIKQLIAMSKLVLAIRDGNHKIANNLWPEVLSYEFWHIPTSTIWQLSWQVSDNRDESIHWSKAVLQEKSTRLPALVFLSLASKTDNESLEAMLDFLIGTDPITTNEPDEPEVYSPLRQFYTSKQTQTENPQLFYETLSHLKILREKLRDYQKTFDRSLKLQDLISFIDMYNEAGQQMINTSPYNQDADAVQIMTVFKAKGLEYEHVFLPCCTDDVWGASSKGNSNKLTLPPNLAPIRHAGATDDERLRILFVALTRAKHGLYISSFSHNYTGKATKRLKYLNEQQQPDGQHVALVLPPENQMVIPESHSAPKLQHMELDWRDRHSDSINVASLRGLLSDRLKNYRLSPTHINTFTDTEYGGPDAFFYNTILRFPQAPTLDNQFGSAMHETMEWLQQQLDRNTALPSINETIKEFTRIMESKKLPDYQTKLEIERGEKALKSFLDQRSSIFKAGDKAEHNFYNEGVVIGEAHLSGKIDRMEINKEAKTITVVDYKTGKPYDKFKKEAKLHKYKQQLYCYKLLIENSHTFAGYKVTEGRLEFLEPDNNGRILHASLSFNDQEADRTKQLIQAIWKRVMNLDLPDISDYSPNYKGIVEFENYLLGQE